MANRPNWHHGGHPPACTCYRCNEGNPERQSRRERGSSGSPPRSSPGRSRFGCFGWIAAVVVVMVVFGIIASALVNNSPQSAPPPRRAVAAAVPTETPPPAHTPIPTAAAAPTPAHTPTPAPTETATPTPTETPSPTPTSYGIDGLKASYLASGGGEVIVDFSMTLRNAGDAFAALPLEARMSVDGAAPELVSVIAGLGMGDERSFVFSRNFAPGVYKVEFTFGDARAEVEVNVESDKVALALATHTPTPSPTATHTATPTATPTATHTPPPTETAIPTATATHTPTPLPTPTAPPAATASPVPTAPPSASNRTSPHLKHLRYKEYALRLINEQRASQGLEPVALGTNDAAQMHADDALANCFSGHWGSDGLKPYMRYTLTGGRQYSAENMSGSDYCIKRSDRYTAISDVNVEIRQSSDGLWNSAGHRRNILRPEHKKVNIGLAWDRYNFKMVQHFEGDYVEYENEPLIQGGVLSFSGRVKNGAWVGGEDGLGVQIYYDRPPHGLTLGQLARTYCYNSGVQAAALREPLADNRFYITDEYSITQSTCPDPYDVAPTAPAPKSHREANAFWQSAYDASQSSPPRSVVVPWITARAWDISASEFSVVADIGRVLLQHGPGVYTVTLWADIGGIREPVSEYSVFYMVDIPSMR